MTRLETPRSAEKYLPEMQKSSYHLCDEKKSEWTSAYCEPYNQRDYHMAAQIGIGLVNTKCRKQCEENVEDEECMLGGIGLHHICANQPSKTKVPVYRWETCREIYARRAAALVGLLLMCTWWLFLPAVGFYMHIPFHDPSSSESMSDRLVQGLLFKDNRNPATMPGGLVLAQIIWRFTILLSTVLLSDLTLWCSEQLTNEVDVLDEIFRIGNGVVVVMLCGAAAVLMQPGALASLWEDFTAGHFMCLLCFVQAFDCSARLLIAICTITINGGIQGLRRQAQPVGEFMKTFIAVLCSILSISIFMDSLLRQRD